MLRPPADFTANTGRSKPMEYLTSIGLSVYCTVSCQASAEVVIWNFNIRCFFCHIVYKFVVSSGPGSRIDLFL